VTKTLSTEDAGAEHTEVMGPELGAIYDALRLEVAWLHLRWKEYVELYGRNQSRIELLNKVSPDFFQYVEHSFWNETLLHISRLTDPARSVNKKENLSVQRLPALLSDEKLRTKVTELINDSIVASAFCRDWRNRRLAHHDLELVTENGARPLAAADRRAVSDVLAVLANILNTIEAHMLNSKTEFAPSQAQGSSLELLYVLRDGLRFRELQLKRSKKNFLDPDFLDGPEL